MFTNRNPGPDRFTFRQVGELRRGGPGHREAAALQDGRLLVGQLRVGDGHGQGGGLHIHLGAEGTDQRIQSLAWAT